MQKGFYRGNKAQLEKAVASGFQEKYAAVQAEFAGESPWEHPENYRADAGLRHAVNVALMLGQPLLITGEPGTGKTHLAKSLAYELAIFEDGLARPLVFHTRSTSSARDLFYSYDMLRHFHDAQFRKAGLTESLALHAATSPESAPTSDLNAENYITYEPLGLAILLSLSPEHEDRQRIRERLPERWRGVGQKRCVVLIDEVDKAPRDLPNDVLNDIENLEFTVHEAHWPPIKADPQYRPILILTSNSEKNLPDAFLRRCVFYNIPFPDEEGLAEIVEQRLGHDAEFEREILDSAIEHFLEIRRACQIKPPATAEFLAWLRVLDAYRLNPDQADKDILRGTYSVLVKNEEDRHKVYGI